MPGTLYQRGSRSLGVLDRTSSNANNATAYLTAAALDPAQSTDISAAVGTIRHGMGAKKVKFRLQSNSDLENLRIGIVYWTQDGTDDTGAPVGYDDQNVPVSADVINGAGVYCSKVMEFDLEAQNYELRYWDAPVGEISIFCWEE